MNIQKLITCAVLAVLHIDSLASDVDSVPLLIVRSDAVRIHFQVEIVATGDARKRGLMGRTYLAPRHGMWFDFEVNRPLAMWMKGTPISLDMLFVDESGTIVHARERTEAFSHAPIKAPVSTRYVLELNAGAVQTYAIALGDRVVIPEP